MFLHIPQHPTQPLIHTPRFSQRVKKIALGVLAILFAVVCGLVLFVLVKSLSVSHRIQIQNPRTSLFSDVKRLAIAYIKKDYTALRHADTGRINILLLGRAGEHYPGKNLTDTVMLMSIDTTNKKIALLSLPRDLYVPIVDTTLFTKINSLYQYGLNQGTGMEPLRTSIEYITGQTVDYFFILDFDGFEKAIDALGGIPIDVLRDFYDPRYPGKNYSYETFEIKKGWQTLDGATALKYVRERHNDPEGDFGRAKRQQQMLQAIKDKAFSLKTFLNIFALNALLGTLGESVKTDMPLDDMEGFLQIIPTLDTENISSVVVDAWKKESLLRVSHIQVGPTTVFILVPRVGTWNELRDMSKNIFRLDTLQARQKRIASEQTTGTLLYAPEDSVVVEKMKRFLIEQMGCIKVTTIPLGLLENRPKQSMITDRSDLQKPWSLDELIKIFSLKKETVFPFTLPPTDTSDFALVIGDDLVDILSFDENDITDILDENTFPELLPPQPR